MPPLIITNRWTGVANSSRMRLASLVDRPETSRRIEALLRQVGANVAYEVFDRDFTLCAPDLPGVAGDPDIALVIGNAEHDLFFVAQRERGGLSAISIHEAIHDAVGDFIRRAVGAAGNSHVAGIVALRDVM
jgi:hypothetical protein